MSQQFNRFTQLIVTTNGQRVELNPQLELEFQVRKNRNRSLNETIVGIKNLQTATKRSILAGKSSFSLVVGYGDARTTLFTSDVVRSRTEWAPPDSVTTVFGLDGVAKLREKEIKVSVAEGGTTGQALKLVLGQLGLEQFPTTVKLSSPLKSGYSHAGKAGDALDELTSEVGATWGIIDGRVLITSVNKGYGGTKLLITPQNGLLAQPEYVEEVETGRIVTENRLPNTGYRLTMLLRPELQPFDVIEVKSRDVSGLFVVDAVEHVGGNRTADFYTKVTVYEQR